MRRLKTVRRPPIYPKSPGHLPCSSLTHPLPLPSRRPSVSFGGFGLKLGVASSSTRVWVEGHLAERGLLALFHIVVTGDDVDSVKPAPDLCVAALDRLGTPPDRAVAIEDSLNGVVAAKSAGMFCVAVPNPMTVDMSLENADLRLGALSKMELQTLLDTLTRPIQGP